MARNHVGLSPGCGTPNRLKSHPSRPPIKRIGETPRWRKEAHDIGRDIIRLNHVLGVLAAHFTPAADLYIHLLVWALAVPGGNSQYDRRFQMRNVAHHEAV